MSEFEGERVGRGCASFINLIVSVAVLIVLLVVFLPGIIELPDWADKIDTGKLLQSRKVLSPVITFNEQDYQESSQILVPNRRIGRPPIGKIIKERKILKDDILRFTYQNRETGGAWEKAFEEIPGEDFSLKHSVFDESAIYFVTQNNLRAINILNSNQIWETSLTDQLDPACADCIKILEGKQILVVLSQDRVLHGINLRDGALLWQVRLNQPSSDGKGFYLVDQNIVLIDRDNAQNNSPQTLAFFNSIDGKRGKSIVLPRLSPKMPILIDNQRLYYVEEKNETQRQLHCIALSLGKQLWEAKLPDKTTILSPNFPVEQDTWYSVDYQYLYLCVSVDERQHEILRFDVDSGQMTSLLQSADFSFSIQQANRRFLIFQAKKTRGSTRYELWVLDKKESVPQAWKYPLGQSNVGAPQEFQPLPWSLKLKPNSELIILEHLPEAKELHLQVLDLLERKRIRQEIFKVRKGDWLGTTWTRNKAYVVIRAVYSLDLENYSFKIDWP